GDGLVDVVSMVEGAYQEAQVYLNIGDGTFKLGAHMTQTFPQGRLVELADLNNDGILDFIATGADPGGDAPLNARLGLGDGTFGSASEYQFAEDGFAITVGDLNDDGNRDIVVASRFHQ